MYRNYRWMNHKFYSHFLDEQFFGGVEGIPNAQGSSFIDSRQENE